jgi:flagellin-specific chaperone FliS
MIDKEAYTYRISQASTAQLVVITMELAESYIKDAVSAHNDAEEYRLHIDKAKDAVMQLIRGLNFDIPLAQDFYEIYQYLYKLLTEAYFGLKTKPAGEALSLIDTLLTGWKEAASVEAAAATVITEQSPQVYAGLTYGRGGLEEYVAQDESRGFKA